MIVLTKLFLTSMIFISSFTLLLYSIIKVPKKLIILIKKINNSYKKEKEKESLN